MTAAATSVRPDATQAAAAPSAAAPRMDFYVSIHRALRAQMCDALTTLGAIDPADEAERVQALDKVDALLVQMRCHLEHENEFVHTAIEARLPGGSRPTADDHVGHVEAITNLLDESRALRDARPEHRGMLCLSLYRHLSAFIAENFEHMLVEERDNNAKLWAHYTDAELVQAHDALVASIPPDEMMRIVRWMVVSMPVPELAGMFADMRTKAPPPAFAAFMDVARTHMSMGRWGQLARALDVSPAPGLVDA